MALLAAKKTNGTQKKKKKFLGHIFHKGVITFRELFNLGVYQ